MLLNEGKGIRCKYVCDFGLEVLTFCLLFDVSAVIVRYSYFFQHLRKIDLNSKGAERVKEKYGRFNIWGALLCM